MMRIGYLGLLLSGMLALAAVQALSDERELVLVGSPALRGLALDPAEIRQLFLGHVVTRDNHEMTAAINKSDALLYEVFLQKVIFMSSQAYERQLVTKVFRYGGQSPPSFDRLDELAAAMQRQPGMVTFMWKDHAPQLPNATVVNEIWRGTIE